MHKTHISLNTLIGKVYRKSRVGDLTALRKKRTVPHRAGAIRALKNATPTPLLYQYTLSIQYTILFKKMEEFFNEKSTKSGKK